MKSITSEEFYKTLTLSSFGQKYLEIIDRNWKLPEDYPKYPRKDDKKGGYEIHHIHPLSLGGEYRGKNRVYLSTLDHILSHYYLALVFPSVETEYAFWCVSGNQAKHLQGSEKEIFCNLEHLSYLREKTLQAKKEGRLGKVNSSDSYRQGWETRRKNGTDRGWKHPEGSWEKGAETKRKNGTYGKTNAKLAWETRRKNGTDHVTEKAKQKRLETLKTSEAWKNCHGSEFVAKLRKTREFHNIQVSEETRKKMSEAKKGKKRVYTEDGKYHYE